MKNVFLLIFLVFSISFCMISCDRNDETLIGENQKPDDSDKPGTKGRLILLYAVAANNLYENLEDDLEELMKVAPKLDLDNNTVLVYSVNPDNETMLRQLIKKGKKGDLKLLREYPSPPLSVNPERISEILEYIEGSYCEYPSKGLILWSHATGWIPWFGGYPDAVKRRTFGSEKFNGSTYQCNITDLAAAIPENTFDFIWFDCCYMANIETIYQLREKTEHVVGYVTEIYESGMPYDLTMPYLLRKEADLKGAAYELFKAYDSVGDAITVSVISTDGLERLANIAGEIFTTGIHPGKLWNIQNYSRMSEFPFYDLGQYLQAYTGVSSQIRSSLREAIGNAVPVKYASDIDFDGRPLNVSEYSGLSIHNYTDSDSREALFYQLLDWYEATRKN